MDIPSATPPPLSAPNSSHVSSERTHRVLGLSVEKLNACWALRNTPLHDLSDDLKRLREQVSSLNLPELRRSHVALGQYDRLFNQYGPRIWPDSAHRYLWLLDADTDSGNRILYPRNLYYSNLEDRKLLKVRFRDWIMVKMVNFKLRNKSNPEQKQQSKSATNITKRARQMLPSASPKAPVVIDLVDNDGDNEPTCNIYSVCKKSRAHPELSGSQAEDLELANGVDVDLRGPASQQHTHRAPSDNIGGNAAAIMRDLNAASKHVRQQTRPVVQYQSPCSNVEVSRQKSLLPPNLNEEQQADWLDHFLAGVSLSLDFCEVGAKSAGQREVSLAKCYTSQELLGRMDGQVSEKARAAGWSVRALVVQFAQSDEIHVTRSNCAEYRRVVRKMARLGKNVSVAIRIEWQVV